MSAIGNVFNSVLFPLLSRLNDASDDFATAYRKARLPWLIVGGWACVGLLAGGPTLIRCLYDERATAAGWIIQVLSVSTWLLCLETAASTALLALGKSQWIAAGSAAKLVGMLVLIPLGFRTAGFPGALYGYAASEFLRYGVCVAGGIKSRFQALTQDLWLTGFVGGTAALGLFTAASARSALESFSRDHYRGSAILEGLAVTIVVSAAWGGMFWWARSRRASAPRGVATLPG
jgi:hypothetical protein